MMKTRCFAALLCASVGLVITGCASTSVTVKKHAAPITYKIGNGGTQYAALPRATTPMRKATPYVPPQAVRPAPMPRAGQSFDQASVDRDLYKHQRVGKSYKIMGKRYTPKHDPSYDVTGIASFYGKKFHGKPTATGETFNMHDLTAAHKTLPLNSMLFVTNEENGMSLMVRLNDRGPFVGDRIIDLSQASAKALGITDQGLARVRVQYAGPADPMAAGRKISPVAPVPAPMPLDNYVEAPRSVPAIPSEPMPFAGPQAPIPAPIAPRSAQPVAPVTPEEDGQVTLTIKGPIHVARHDSAYAQPRFIAERLEK